MRFLIIIILFVLSSPLVSANDCYGTADLRDQAYKYSLRQKLENYHRFRKYQILSIEIVDEGKAAIATMKKKENKCKQLRFSMSSSKTGQNCRILSSLNSIQGCPGGVN